MDYLFVATGLLLLIFGGDALVRGAVGLAQRLGISPLVIGLTVVAYGTSAPELLVSIDAALAGAPDIAVGNVVGSNIANILLIVGCGALIAPMRWAPGAMRVDTLVMLAASIALVLLGLGMGALTPLSGIAMLVLLIAYTAWQYRAHQNQGPSSNTAAIPGLSEHGLSEPGLAMVALPPPWCPVLALTLGLLAVVAGSHILVIGAVGLARILGMSEAAIGLTLVAVGTSLPELATTLVAAYRRHADVALGNVVGSNIFNILGILGLVPIFGSLAIPESIIDVDLWVMLGTALLLTVWMAARQTFGRGPAALCLAAYGTYIAYQYFGPPAALAGPAV